MEGELKVPPSLCPGHKLLKDRVMTLDTVLMVFPPRRLPVRMYGC